MQIPEVGGPLDNNYDSIAVRRNIKISDLRSKDVNFQRGKETLITGNGSPERFQIFLQKWIDLSQRRDAIGF